MKTSRPVSRPTSRPLSPLQRFLRSALTVFALTAVLPMCSELTGPPAENGAIELTVMSPTMDATAGAAILIVGDVVHPVVDIKIGGTPLDPGRGRFSIRTLSNDTNVVAIDNGTTVRVTGRGAETLIITVAGATINPELANKYADTLPIIAKPDSNAIRVDASRAGSSGVVGLDAIGDTVTLRAVSLSKPTGTPPERKAVKGGSVVWTSSNPAIVRIDSLPTVGRPDSNLAIATSVTPGTATITATFEGVATQTKVITVTQTTTNYVFEKASTPGTLINNIQFNSKGDTATIRGIPRDKNKNTVQNPAAPVFQVPTDRTSQVTVDANLGLLTAVDNTGDKAVKLNVAGFPNDSVAVIVKQIADSIRIQGARTVSLSAIGEPSSFTANVFDLRRVAMGNAGNIWSSSNTSVAVFDDETKGDVRAVGIGTAQLRVSRDGKFDEITLNVSNDPKTVEATPATLPLKSLTETGQVSAKFFNSRDVEIPGTANWTSLNPTIATVTAGPSVAATVTAIAVGQAKIVGTSATGAGADTVIVNITNNPATVAFTISPKTVTLASIGDTLTPPVPVSFKNAKGVSLARNAVTWSSVDVNVARPTLDGLGGIVGVGKGETQIIAKSADGAADTVGVIVTNAPASVVMNRTNDQLSSIATAGNGTIGVSSLQYTADVFNAKGALLPSAQLQAEPVTWRVTNGTVANVTTGGLVTALAVGTTSIIAEIGGSTTGLRADTATLTVTNSAVSMTVSPSNLSITSVGSTSPLTASATNSAGGVVNGQNFTWSTSDALIATVSNTGVVKAEGTGTATITATIPGSSPVLSASSTVTVTNLPTTIDIVSPDTTLASVGDSYTPSVNFRNANNAVLPITSVNWNSDDPLIVSVTSNGLIKAVAPGTTKIRATNSSNSAITDFITVTVSNAAATVTLNPGTAQTLTSLGQTLSISATVKNAANQPIANPTVVWEVVGDSTVVTAVTSGVGSGLITALTNGTRTVRATSGTITQTISITVAQAISPAQSTVTAAQTSLVANGLTSTTITVQLKDANNNNYVLSNPVMTITPSTGTLGPITNNGNGNYTATLTSPTVSGPSTTTVSAGAVGLTNTAIVTFTPGPDTQYLVTSSNATPVAGNSVVITAQLKDVNGNNVPTPVARTITWTNTGGGSFGAPTSTTNSSGAATVTFTTAATATNHTVTATDNAGTPITGISSLISPVSGVSAQYTVVANDSSVVAGNSITITAQLRDGNGNAISLGGRNVTWNQTGSVGSFGSPTSTTNTSGVATVSFTPNTTAGSSTTITATDAGNSVVAGSNVVVTTLPAVPVGSAASSVSSVGFTANWGATLGAASYRLDVSTDVAFSSLVVSNQVVGGTSQAVGSLTAGTTYFFRVRAVNGADISANSNTVAVTTLATPSASAASGISTTSFTANWPAYSGATGYQLDVSTENTFTTGLLGAYTNKAIGATTSDAVTGLTAGTNYFYRIRAVVSGVASANSATISTTTLTAAPTATAATSVSATGFTANWGTAASATSYRLDIATDAGFTTFVSGYNDLSMGNATSAIVTGLSSGTSYFYRVRAVNASGTGASSNTITVLTIPAAPTVTSPTGISGVAFTANWTSVTGAASYRLDVSTASDFSSFVSGYNDLVVGGTTQAVTGLNSATTYFYRARAVNATGASASSSSITAVTSGAAQLLFVIQPAASTVAGVAISPTIEVEVRDASGNPVTTDPNGGVTETVTLAFTGGTNTEGATLSGTLTANINWATGRATFANISANLVGSYNLTATEGGFSSGLADATSSAFSITHAAANQLVVFTQPASSSASMASVTTVIEVRDAFGNTVTTDPNGGVTENVTVSFTSGTNTEGATLGGTTTQNINWATGRATFNNLTVNKTGSYSLDAVEGGAGFSVTDAVTSAFSITHAAASTLAVLTQPPTSTTANVNFGTVIEVRDAQGNRVTTDPNGSVTETVTLAFTSGTNTEGATLGGTLTANIDWTTGTATFTQVTADRAGSYQLDATEGGAGFSVTDATTNAFSITAGATQLAFVASLPASTVAGVAITSFDVEVRDALGNAITTDPNGGVTETITLSFTTGTNTEGATLSGTTTANINWATGRATFANISANLTGSYNLTAIEGGFSSGLADAVSSAFSITHAAANQLVVLTQPASSSASMASITTVVEVRDAFGNTVTTDPNGGVTETVTMSFTAGTNTEGSTLGGTTTQNINWGTGRATFNNLTVNKTGSYSLDAVEGGAGFSVTDAVTNAFSITHAAASTLAVLTQPPTSSTAGVNFGTVIEVRDAQGNRVTTDPNGSVTETVTLAFTSGTNTEGATLGGTATVNIDWTTGTATFTNLTVDRAGSYQLDATEGGAGFSVTDATTNAFSITAAPSQLAFVASLPASTVAGVAITSFDVEVRDALGNAITTDPNGSVTETITLGFTAGTNTEGATLSGTTTANINWATGRATFANISANLVGSYSLTATAGNFTNSISTGVSSTFSITHAAINQIAYLTGPTTTVSAATMSPAVVVEVRDALGNAVTTDPNGGQSETIALTLTTANGAILSGGGATAVDWTTGRATFNSLSVNKTGTYTLTATPTNLAPAGAVVSSSFAITHAAATTLAVLTQPPTSSGVGASFGTVIEVRDAQGNRVTTDPNAGVTETVTLAFTSGTNTEGATLGGTTTVNIDWTTGLATFTNLTVDKAGSFQLDATEGGAGFSVTDATTNAFTIIATSTQLAFVAGLPASTVAGVAITSFDVEVRDLLGNAVTVDPNGSATESITLAFTSGTNTEGATLSGTVTANVDWTTGRATFANISANLIGSYSLTASANNFSSSLTNGVSSTFSITHAAASQLAVLTQPASSAISMASLATVIEVRDAFGNPVTTDPNGGVTETVTLSFTSGTNTEGATLGGTATQNIDWSTGRATFSNTINKVGAYTLDAVEGGAGFSVTDAVTNNITITHAAANTLAVLTQPPTSSTAGVNFSTVIEVRDAQGNRVTTDPNGSVTETVTLAFTSGTNTEGATLGGTLTANIDWTTGTATFTNLTVDRAGSYQLDATEGGAGFSVTDATTNAFNITAAPTQLAFVASLPASTVAGVSITSFDVEVRDALGNAITADPNGSVTETITLAFTSGTNTEGATLSGTTTANINWATGRATFANISANLVGSYNLTATESGFSSGLADAVSSAFSITHAAASQLAVVTQPASSAISMATLTTVIEVRDALGNPVTTDPSGGTTENITVAFTSGTNTEGATLGGTATQNIDWSTGRATFNNLTINRIGAYTLTATEDVSLTLTDAVTNNITITHAAASTLAVLTQPATSSTAGSSFGTVIEVRDAQGNRVTTDPNGSVTETVTLAFTSGTNTEGATLGGTTTVNIDWTTGTATFANLTVDRAGSYQLDATEGGAGFSVTDATTNAFSITAAPSQLAFVASLPASTVAGVSITSFDVEVRDALGNAITTDPNGAVTETITLGFTAGTNTEGATLSGTVTGNIDWTTGRATFANISVNLIGSYSLTATAGNFTSSISTGVSSAFSITHAAISQIAFLTGPSTTVSAATMSPAVVVEVRDALGNAVTTDPNGGQSETIALTLTTANGAILTGGGAAAVNWTTGRATFSGLSVNKSGSYTLTATPTNLAPAGTVISSSFVITHAAANTLAVLTQPATSSAVGASFGTVIEVRDAQGNRVTTDPDAGTTETVTLAFTSGTNTEGATLGGTTTVNIDWTTGLATFTNLTVDKAGSYQLDATEGGAGFSVTDATTNAFTITATPTQLAFAVQPTSAVAGVAISPSIEVEVRDALGNAVTVDPNGSVTESITLAFTSGTNTEGATLSGTLTGNINWATGRATFANISANLIGSYSLTASANNFSTSLTTGVSSAFSITHAAASQLAVATQPSSSAISMASLATVIEVRDAFGNAVTTDPNGGVTETVTLSFTSGTNTEGATLGGTATQNIDWSTGRATFSNTINKIGAYTLDAVEGGAGFSVTDAVTNNITITHAAANTLAVLTQPATSSTAGIAFGTVIEVRDAQGNRVTTDPNGSVTETVSLAFTTGTNTEGATLGGTFTANIDWTTGTATFTNLTVNKAGNYSLDATEGGAGFSVTDATTSAFDITAAPTQLAFAVQPAASTVAGVGISPDIEVEVRDANGTAITADPNGGVTETITLAFTSGTNTEGATLSGTLTANINWATGRATFTGISANLIGSYSLTATANNFSTSLTTGVSSAFSITHAAASQLAVATQPSSSAISMASLATVIEVRDAFGNAVTTDPNGGVTETVTLSFTSGTNTEGATLGGTATQNIDWSTGRATFSNTINRIGSYTLDAVEGGAGFSVTDAVTNNITITHAAANTLAVLTQPPTSSTAGSAFGTVIEVRDAQGNRVTTDPNGSVTETVTLAFTSGTNTEGATLGGTLTANIDWTTGTATFTNLTVDRAGSYQLDATEGGAGFSVTDATTNAFSITAAPTQLAFVASLPASTVAGVAITSFDVEVRDALGNAITSDPNGSVTESITLAFTSGTNTEGATLSGTLTGNINWATGRATFANISANLVGSYSLTATANNFSTSLTNGVSSSFTITHAAASQLAVLTQPASNAISMASLATVIEVRDAFGNPVTTDPNGGVTETVTLSFTSGTNTEGATLGGTATQNIDWSTGRATFSNTINKIGSYTLDAVEGGAGFSVTDTVTNNITITHAAANTLAVLTQPPTSSTAGSSFGTVIEVRDAQGNRVTTDPNGSVTETVTLAFTSGTNTEGATLGGTLTVNIDWTTGTATFTNLTVNKAGNYSLDATEGGVGFSVTDATTSAFDITAAPTQLAFAVQPAASTVAGVGISPDIEVEVRDANGTVITADPNGGVTETITLAFTSGTNTEGATLSGTLTTNINWTTGRATFTGISANLIGSYSLTATANNFSTSLTNGVSSAFSITHATASQLAVVTQPASSAISMASLATVIEVRDAFGNPVTTDPNGGVTETVTLSFTTGTNTEGATLGGTATQNIDWSVGSPGTELEFAL